jgi:MoxR-like ATPase
MGNGGYIMDLQRIGAFSSRIKENIGKVIVGKDKVVDMVLVSLVTNGHVLLEDVPGTGKTMLAKALARTFNCSFKRIQFTPDLLPTDVTGMNIYNQKSNDFEFKPGPLFSNIILADEINRATPRTQSSLLEGMEERQITIDGNTRILHSPFFVIATQNPIELQGTFPLPEAQLDRFLMKLKLGYPSTEEAFNILDRYQGRNPLDTLLPAATQEELVEIQQGCQQITVGTAIKEYIVAIVERTRTFDKVLLGVSPRGSLALMRACQAYAALKGRDYVLPDDVKTLAEPVLSHRIITRNFSSTRDELAQQIIRLVLEEVPVPFENNLHNKQY